MQDDIKNVYMYLRKSRADLEAEARGEGETLARHRKTLLAIAKRNEYNVLSIYEEVVSGEKLVTRPKMLQLLQDIEDHPCDAVMVMDIDRLGRGDMQDQGLILETFKMTNTKIITPNKTYDLSDEFDEDYSEFEAFMARKEYKMIKKRMQRGRLASVKEGNYIMPIPPYGFEIVSDSSGRYLKPKDGEFDTLLLINTLYADDHFDYGGRNIAKYLDNLGVPTPTGKPHWDSSTVLAIIKNPACDGKVKWQGKLYDGKQGVVMDQALRKKVLQKLSSRYHLPYKQNCPPSNPFAGIAVCGYCGKKLLRRPNGQSEPRIMCGNTAGLCDCRSVRMDYFEAKVLTIMRQQLQLYAAEIAQRKVDKKARKKVISLAERQLQDTDKEISEYVKQKNNLHTLLERDVYDIDTFLERSGVIATEIDRLTAQKATLQNQIAAEHNDQHTAEIMYPRLKHVLDVYDKSKTPQEKNLLLRSVVDHIVYRKTKDQRDDDFDIEIYMLTPAQLPDL